MVSPSEFVEVDVIDRGGWRIVVSAERFERAWFPRVCDVDFVYHFQPKERTLSVHFGGWSTINQAVPGGLYKLALELGGKVVGRSLRLPGVENRESAVLMAEFLQQYFEESQEAHAANNRAAS